MEKTAVELAAASTRFGSPDEGLRAVAELRRRLEDLEAWHVENAVRAGRSWAQVAAALGVSKQAAHKKHAQRLRATARSSFATAARERGIVVTAEARRAVKHAASAARELGHGRLGTVHLLLGLLREEHGASRALVGAGVSAEQLRRGLSIGEERPENGRLAVTQRGRAALEQSLREAVARGDRYLGVEHMLLALVRDDASASAKALAGLGVTRRKLEDALP